MGTFIFWDRGSIEFKNCFNSKSKLVLYKYSMQVSSASFTMMLFALYQFYMLCNSFFFFGGELNCLLMDPVSLFPQFLVPFLFALWAMSMFYWDFYLEH